MFRIETIATRWLYSANVRSVDEWKACLRAALLEARRARDPEAISVLRDTLARIDNAEARDISAAQHAVNGEIDRRVLTPEETMALLEAELRERRAASAHYASLGQATQSDALARQASVLERVIAPSPPTS